MKKIAMLLSLVVFVLAFAACGGVKSDANKIKKSVEKLTKVSNEAAADKKLDAKEIEEINGLLADMKKLGEEIEKKEKEDAKYKTDMEAFEKENKAEMDKVSEEFMKAFTKLQECEGFDKIKFE
jgi:septal ring factor EnvC (AmiA/AmiB activator)